jgi:hypothetical protein
MNHLAVLNFFERKSIIGSSRGLRKAYRENFWNHGQSLHITNLLQMQSAVLNFFERKSIIGSSRGLRKAYRENFWNHGQSLHITNLLQMQSA